MEKNLIGGLRQLYPFLALIVLFVLAGCQTQQTQSSQMPGMMAEMTNHVEAIILREGDDLRITFPANSALDATQSIRRDGKIQLSMVGEITAAGLTPAELEKEILKKYAGQILASQEVIVTVTSSTFPVFVTGAVVHPQKISSNHPITALEAIMEAGGFDYSKANLKAVVVIRMQEGRTDRYTLNLKDVLDGKNSQLFYLKPLDIVYVKEKFSWL